MQNLIMNKKSNFIHKLLRSDNMHNLILDKIKLKDKVNDHFDDLKKRQHILFQQFEINNSIFGEINNEKSLEQKNFDLDKKLVSLYKFHSDKFHKLKFIKLKDDLLNMRLNLLKKSEIEKLNSKNNNSVSRLRQKIAFKFRFMNKTNNNKNKKLINYKKQNERMNKILKISKSIPDILYKEITIVRENEENNKENNESNKNTIDQGLYIPLKSKRYSGNIYDYYKSDKPLYYHSNTIKGQKSTKNKEQFNPSNKSKNTISIINENKIDSSNNKRRKNFNKIKVNKENIKKIILKKDGLFKLDSLLS